MKLIDDLNALLRSIEAVSVYTSGTTQFPMLYADKMADIELQAVIEWMEGIGGLTVITDENHYTDMPGTYRTWIKTKNGDMEIKMYVGFAFRGNIPPIVARVNELVRS